MLLHKSVVHDSRVQREAKALAEDGHEVTVLELAEVPLGEEHLYGFRRRSVIPPGWIRRAVPFQLYRLVFAASFVRGAVDERSDVLHAHDAAMLLPGLIARRITGARLVYDSHELATGVPYRDPRWALFVRAIEAVAIPRCAAVITVSEGIARRLQRSYGLGERPSVVRNVADAPLPPDSDEGLLRRTLAIGDAPLVLHLGSAAPGRGADILVRAMAYVRDAHLALLGASLEERQTLLELAAQTGVRARVHALAPVAVDELLTWTASADVGVSLLQNTCQNHRLALPNKVFEYLAAGVPVVVSRLPELTRLVTELGVGWAVNGAEPEAVAEGLRTALSARRDAALSGRVCAASMELRWSVERRLLLAVYQRLEEGEQRELELTYGRYRTDPGKGRAWSADNRGNATIRREILRAVVGVVRDGISSEGMILDIGCGTGWLLRELTAIGVHPDRLAGVDLLIERVRAAREAAGVAVVRADASDLPYPDDRFDLALLITTLSSITKAGMRADVLREAERVVRPDGVIAVYDTRVGNPANGRVRKVAVDELTSAAQRSHVTAERIVTVLPPLARRLGALTDAVYPLLARCPLVLTHRLTLLRVEGQLDG
jgi:glycosyltransferase involved in cell wall biosynthesis